MVLVVWIFAIASAVLAVHEETRVSCDRAQVWAFRAENDCLCRLASAGAAAEFKSAVFMPLAAHGQTRDWRHLLDQGGGVPLRGSDRPWPRSDKRCASESNWNGRPP